jgi:hypothetical protein
MSKPMPSPGLYIDTNSPSTPHISTKKQSGEILPPLPTNDGGVNAVGGGGGGGTGKAGGGDATKSSIRVSDVAKLLLELCTTASSVSTKMSDGGRLVKQIEEIQVNYTRIHKKIPRIRIQKIP